MGHVSMHSVAFPCLPEALISALLSPETDAIINDRLHAVCVCVCVCVCVFLLMGINPIINE